MKLIDVSSNNHPDAAPIDWDKVKAAGVDGVYVKATEGAAYKNPWMVRDATEAARAGLLVGFYHFARFDLNSGDAEAQLFVRMIGGKQMQLPPMLDLETGEGIGWGTLGFHRDVFHGQMDTAGYESGDYMNLNFLRNVDGGTKGRLLWLADPEPEPSEDCWLWQYGVEPVDGCPNPVDVNQLRGDLVSPMRVRDVPGGVNTGQPGGQPGTVTPGGKHVRLNAPIVGPPILTPTGKGYWLIGADGGVFAFGDAWVPDANPLPAKRLNAPVTGATCTTSGKGLLLTAADGGVFALGDAPDFGNMTG